MAERIDIYHHVDMGSLAGRFDHLEDLILGTHRAEMRKIDRETNELAAQIEALATGGDAETVARLHAIAERLNAMCHVPDAEPTT